MPCGRRFDPSRFQLNWQHGLRLRPLLLLLLLFHGQQSKECAIVQGIALAEKHGQIVGHLESVGRLGHCANGNAARHFAHPSVH